MSEQNTRTTQTAKARKPYRSPTAEKTRLENIVAGNGSCNYDFSNMRDHGCDRPQ